MAMFDLGKRSGQSKQPQEEPMDALDTVFDRSSQRASSPASAESTGVRRREAAVIGPSIHIEGTLRGEEDLLIEGHVKGEVRLQGNSLTIGPQGRVEANMHARTIYVDGTVQGDLHGSELVAIRKTAQIRGNIWAPRVSLEDGARFKGSIDMDTQPESAQGQTLAGSATKPAASPGSSTVVAKPSGDESKSSAPNKG